jgi:hypothetical protein
MPDLVVLYVSPVRCQMRMLRAIRKGHTFSDYNFRSTADASINTEPHIFLAVLMHFFLILNEKLSGVCVREHTDRQTAQERSFNGLSVELTYRHNKEWQRSHIARVN